ncbi:MAG: HAMP domain-containing histidine kinase [Pseudomonadota bacterium]|nr:HAMP domain-containing histidine kinase [Pseudomonadota bacterium]
MWKVRLLATASFRLTLLYLLLFTLSAVAIDGATYLYIRRAQDAAFVDRIEEETQAFLRFDRVEGRARLIANIAARSTIGSSLVYGLYGADGARLAGRTPPSAVANGRPAAGWTESPEWEEDEPDEATPDIVRMLTTRLDDGALLLVGDERTAVDMALRGATIAFGWGLAATLALGLAGGLWLSRQFLNRLEAMRNAAQAVMDGDWRRRIASSAIDDDLASLARTFNRLFDRIEKLLLAQKHAGSDIAHDLRRPLAKVLRELERGRDDPEAVGRAIAGVEDVLRTFEALLRIGEIESGARKAAFAEFDLAEAAADVVEAFRPAAEEQGRVFSARFEPGMRMRGDAALMKQAIANLIDNALRHTPPGAAIEVYGAPTREGVRLEIADRGPGVAEEDRGKLFRRFFRADAARRSPGSGLGLALAAAIADLHDMEAEALDNRPGLRIVLRSHARRD